jgi:universal stress protein F
MYSNIVIPTSFDEGRDITGAIEIAKAISTPDATITFLHVIEQIPVYATEFVPTEVLTEKRGHAKEKLEKLATKLPNGRTALVDGPTGRSITNWADDNGADCIVIPSHRPVLSDILLGTTSAWVVRHANCAVHVIR